MSSRVADRLGNGSFGAARSLRSERGRAKAVTEGAIPAYELVRLRLATVAPCPMNPRRNFGSDETKTALGNSLTVRQTTACVAVSREAYLKLWPNHERLLDPAAEHVLLNGERRYRSALHVGLDTLDFVVRDDLATSREDFLDALLLENEDRSDFDVIERARGIKQLLEACGGNAAEVARRRGRDRSWVGNQIALLTLPPRLQEQLAVGELAERYGRRLARALKENPALGTEELLELAEQFKDEERVRRDQDRELRELAKAGALGSGGAVAPVPAPAQERVVERVGEGAMLSADNIGSAAPAVGMLSADNIEEGEAAVEMLSADNIPAPEVTAPVPHQVQEEAPRDDSRERVRRLGATVEERAETLRRGSSPEELTALIEALLG
ncbi:ParB/RepB/Spo0J family partition protein [Kitasatospora sp. NPDC006697]|uniref:ParB/RepB/Spo0J family partition protein n=1 Tax=Kitasatospora sp. NPDC006697 TaxID=3364020 RepID=UPI0036A43D61